MHGCPVVYRYLRRMRKQFFEYAGPHAALYEDAKDSLYELEAHNAGPVSSRDTQLLRAFYCLDQLAALLAKLEEVPHLPLERTYEGIQDLVRYATEREEASIVSSTEMKLTTQTNSMDKSLRQLHVIDLERSETFSAHVVKAAEFLRPRLRNDEDVGGLGEMLAEGLALRSSSADVFLHHGTNLLNIGKENGIIK